MSKKNLVLRNIVVQATRQLSLKVAYLIQQNVVYYCATAPCKISSINCAECIVAAIAELEQIAWQAYVFIDLQTVAAYPELGTEQGYPPGYYVADRVLLNEHNQKPHVYGFELVQDTPFAKCQGRYPPIPKNIEELFAAFIWKH